LSGGRRSPEIKSSRQGGDVELVQQSTDPTFDVVADDADVVERLAGRAASSQSR
jgi:hypothetical protein